jgi:hypothetical protein
MGKSRGRRGEGGCKTKLIVKVKSELGGVEGGRPPVMVPVMALEQLVAGLTATRQGAGLVVGLSCPDMFSALSLIGVNKLEGVN